MSSDDSASAMKALRLSDYAYIGVRPADEQPAEGPTVILGDHDADGLAYALAQARHVWPDCEAWALVGSDEKMIRTDPTWAPSVHALRTPQQLATFTTA